MLEKEMREIAEFFLEKNQPSRLDYAKKYEELLKQVSITPTETVTECADKEKLITELKAFRLNRSRSEKIKPYYIFNDAQMEELITKNPKNKDELCQVSGFGKVKAEKYGDEIVGILERYSN